MGPKLYARIARFDQAFRLKEQQPALDWLAVALHTGYYDYRHLVRDFEAFAGVTPPQLLAADAAHTRLALAGGWAWPARNVGFLLLAGGPGAGALPANQPLTPHGNSLARLPAADAAAIRQTVARMTANGRNHQFADMAAYTTPDVSWVNIVGMWWRGRPAVQAAHQQIFDAMFTGVAFAPGPLAVRAVAPGVAVANLYCHVGAFYPPDGVNHGNNKEGDDDDLLTLVLVKQRGRWLLAAGQNTVVRAAAAANNPVPTVGPVPFDPAKLPDLH